MTWLRTLAEQLRTVWNSASPLARTGIVAAAALSIVAIVAVAIISSRPQYVAVANNLSPNQSAEIVSKLDANGIDNQLNFSGSTVLVAKTQVNKARLLLGDLVDPFQATTEEFSESLLGDPTLNQFRILEHRERTLEAMITGMRPVVSAQVQLSQPASTPFLDEQPETTASVVVELKPGAALDRQFASSIVSMVAGSVEGLSPANVTVVDTSGRSLSGGFGGGNSKLDTQLEYRNVIEAHLVAKAQLMLDQVLGSGKSVVRVTADVDFTEKQQTSTEYDSESKVKKSEITTSTKITGQSGRGAGGPAGVGSNVTQPSLGGSGGPFNETSETFDTQYETPSTVNTITESTGDIQRLTVAATVDLANQSSEEGQVPITKEDVEGLIQNAVGFDLARGDQIHVVVASLQGIAPTGDTTLLQHRQWDEYAGFIRNASLGIAALVALLLGWMTLRKMKPMVVENPESLSLERSRIVAEFREHAEHDPQMVSRIIAAWLDEPDQDEESSDNNSGETAQPSIRMAA